MDSYTITKEGYQKLLEEMQELKRKFAENERAMSYSFQSAAGDGAHDNGEFEALQGNERMLVSQMEYLQQQIDSAQIIEIPELEEGQVNINDSVLLRVIFGVDDVEEETYTLVGTDGNINENKISINSPIGRAIFQRFVGETVPFTVNGNTFNVSIVEKVPSINR